MISLKVPNDVVYVCVCCVDSHFSTPLGEWCIAIILSVCLSVCVCLSLCVSVCPRAYLWNRWTFLHEIFCADPIWLWLDPPLVALRYVMYIQVLWMMSHLAVVGCMAMRRRLNL